MLTDLVFFNGSQAPHEVHKYFKEYSYYANYSRDHNMGVSKESYITGIVSRFWVARDFSMNTVITSGEKLKIYLHILSVNQYKNHKTYGQV